MSGLFDLKSSRRLSIAPMMDWTDRHCRVFHRLLAPHALLYTEMVTTGALLHGDVPRHLDFSALEHPLALQLGGSEPADLARCAKLGEQWGYDEINLNCGCPSERVQRGAFGACLMLEPGLVADCVKAMRDAVSVPVTIKHRLGVNKIEDYAFVRDFVGALADAGCEVFIVHARNAVLKGLSPKQNREVPPLKYEFVHRLKQDFPTLTMVLNGGLNQVEQAQTQLAHVDGVMLGRVAYHEPYQLLEFEHALFSKEAQTKLDAEKPRARVDFGHEEKNDDLFSSQDSPTINAVLEAKNQQGSEEKLSQEQIAQRLQKGQSVIESMLSYCTQQQALGVSLFSITRHMLGLFNGVPGARAWRRAMSDTQALAQAKPETMLRAMPQSACLK